MQSLTEVHLTVHENAAELCKAALSLLVSIVNSSAPSEKLNHRVSIALSGGSTPKVLYKMLREEHPDIATERLQYFFGDVRMVPNDNADSNFLMAWTSLLEVVDPTHVVTVDTSTSAAVASEQFAAALTQNLPLREDGTPQFDIVLLGVGPDGHTASLFPGTEASREAVRLVVPCMPNEGVTPYVERVTITSRVIQAASHVVILATGKEKKWVLDGIQASEDEIASNKVTKVPVARLVRHCRGSVHLLVDRAMAFGE